MREGTILIPSARPLILVAEDDESNYQYMEAVIKMCGCDILYAMDGVQAVKLCRENPGITFVLMDIRMPKLNGLEATKQIREFRPSLPIIALTAYALTGDKDRMLAGGCDAYMPKPVLPEMLRKLIRRYSV
jgi:CheY-like chemotaxis protein